MVTLETFKVPALTFAEAMALAAAEYAAGNRLLWVPLNERDALNLVSLHKPIAHVHSHTLSAWLLKMRVENIDGHTPRNLHPVVCEHGPHYNRTAILKLFTEEEFRTWIQLL